MKKKYYLGIDTGGTNTDCVILDKDTMQVIDSAKAFTTYSNLSRGIGNALRSMDFDKYDAIGKVSLSTTLATNSIVEGRGCRVGLIMEGKEFDEELPVHRWKNVGGKLDIRGKEKEPLDENDVYSAVKGMAQSVDAFAVSGYASVRNPSHELRIKEIINELTDLPVFCAHELSSSLGVRERTVTAILNASLIKIIHDFIDAAKAVLSDLNIDAPLMIVRSDGSLMNEATARKRPIDTILSGPAASILGAKHLTNRQNAFILDMGGTTTDIADLEEGCVSLNSEGAFVGGWLTRCRAASVSTHGIGGDSVIDIDEEGGIKIGPVKASPVSTSIFMFPYLKKEYDDLAPWNDLRCYELTQNNALDMVEDPKSRAFLSLFRDGAHTVEEVMRRARRQGLEPVDFDRCVKDNLLRPITLTPTDILHITGKFTPWDREAPDKLLSLHSVKAGIMKEDLLYKILLAIEKKLVFSLLQSTADFNGRKIKMTEDPSTLYLMDKAFVSDPSEFLHAKFSLRKPIIAVGGPVKAWMPEAAEDLHTELVIPDHAEVANAIGAAVAEVHEIAEAFIRPSANQSIFTAYLPDRKKEFTDYRTAEEYTKDSLADLIKRKISDQGIDDCNVIIREKEIRNDIFTSEKSYWIETRFTAESDTSHVIG